MNQGETLKNWLWIAWRKGQQTERLAKKVQRGMPMAEAVKEYERPIGAYIYTVLSASSPAFPPMFQSD